MEFQRRISIFFCLILFALALALSISALSTDFWIETDGLERNGTLLVHSFVYSGLFRGFRQIEWSFVPRYTQFSVLDEVRGSINKAQLIFIVILGVLGIIWTAVGLIISLVNTVIQSVNTIAGQAGICLWGALAAFSNSSAIAIFIYNYHHSILHHVLLTEHVNAGFSSKNRTRLGFSFWLFVASTVTQFLPILLTLFSFRRMKRIGTKNELKDDSHDATILMY